MLKSFVLYYTFFILMIGWNEKCFVYPLQLLVAKLTIFFFTIFISILTF